MPKATATELIGLLAPTLGPARSRELVDDAVRALAILDRELDDRQVRAILDFVGRSPGIAPMAVRFARSRYDRRVRTGENPVAVLPTPTPHAAEPPPPSSNDGGRAALASLRTSTSRLRSLEQQQHQQQPTDVQSLIALLAPTVGTEKSTELVQSAMRSLAIVPSELDRDAALRVFDQLARQPGIIGVAARFAKARFILHRDER